MACLFLGLFQPVQNINSQGGAETLLNFVCGFSNGIIHEASRFKAMNLNASGYSIGGVVLGYGLLLDLVLAVAFILLY